MIKDHTMSIQKITRVLDFRPKFSIDDAVISLQAFKNKLLVNTMDSIEYSNVEILKKMKSSNKKSTVLITGGADYRKPYYRSFS